MTVKPIVLIITGLSGSGKTIALRAIEDSGFFCIDNLPVALIDSFLSLATNKTGLTKIGIGIDIREQMFLADIESALLSLRGRYNIEVVFLDTETGVLIRRFKETRRPHPLHHPGTNNIEKSIDEEKKLLEPLRKSSDRLIDTSSFTPHQLRQMVISLYGGRVQAEGMALMLISFGYKFGIPQNVDLLFDVRFIPNPHFVEGLRELKGTDKAVQQFIFRRLQTRQFMKKISELLDMLLPLYIREGKSSLTIGFGCTGGRHRSPAIVEKTAELLKGNAPDINIIHRDMGNS